MDIYNNRFTTFIIEKFGDYLNENLYYKIKYRKSITDYLEFVTTNQKYQQYLMGQNSGGSLWHVEIFDVLDNDGMNKLIRALYKLNKEQFKVKNRFRKPPLFRKLSYTRIQINYTGHGALADIKLENDNYIDRIELSYTQINNQQFVICYKFLFKRIFDSLEQINAFVAINIKKTFKGYYQSVYNFANIVKDNDIENILKIEQEFFRDIFQSYILQNLYTNYGEKYKLPILFFVNYSKDILKVEERLRKPFLVKSFYNKKDSYFLTLNRLKADQGISMNVYFKTNVKPQLHLLSYFQYFGNEFYYYIFENLECNELDLRIGKYLNKRKKYINIKDCHWIINKLRAIKDNELKVYDFKKYTKDMVDVWENFDDSKVTGEKFINYPSYIEKYENIYNQHLQYFNGLFGVQNNTLVLNVTIWTLLFTVLGVLLTIFTIAK